jgi:MarR family transcriptional repressor of emrRAB
MNMHPEQIGAIEASLASLAVRMPDAPLDGILLTRLLLFLGQHVGMMLDHHIRPFGLSEGEFRVLTALFAQPHGMASPGELCSRVSQSPANMSRLSDALVSRELITRESSALDRRRTLLRITDKGAELVRRLLPSMFRPLRELVGVLTEPEQRLLIDLLKRLVIKVDAVRVPELTEPVA